jgi:hypothetical protein
MEQVPGGKDCTRMRPKLHLLVLGHAFRITGIMVLLVIWKAVLCHIDLFERSYLDSKPWDISVKFFPSTLLEPIDTLEVAQAAGPVTLMASYFGRVTYPT